MKARAKRWSLVEEDDRQDQTPLSSTLARNWQRKVHSSFTQPHEWPRFVQTSLNLLQIRSGLVRGARFIRFIQVLTSLESSQL